MKKISVIIPVYNAGKVLPKTLAALETQSLEGDAFEVLVIDGCSSDNSPQIAQDFALRISRTSGPGSSPTPRSTILQP